MVALVVLAMLGAVAAGVACTLPECLEPPSEA